MCDYINRCENIHFSVLGLRLGSELGLGFRARAGVRIRSRDYGLGVRIRVRVRVYGYEYTYINRDVNIYMCKASMCWRKPRGHYPQKAQGGTHLCDNNHHDIG